VFPFGVFKFSFNFQNQIFNFPVIFLAAQFLHNYCQLLYFLLLVMRQTGRGGGGGRGYPPFSKRGYKKVNIDAEAEKKRYTGMPG
jgi:hypothetical protein